MSQWFQETAENMKMMALKVEYCVNSRIFYVLFSVIYGCSSLDTATYYMDSGELECGREHVLAGATVYSHYQTKKQTNYGNNIDCRLTFKAQRDGWRLMLKVEELDIPDSSYGLCNDAVYLYDSHTYIFGATFEEAGGVEGFCGNTPPQVIYSSGQYLTIYFRTDTGGKTGRGFKFTITAFTEDFEQFGSCGRLFKCGTSKCIDPDLLCDTVDHCTDNSDEQEDGEAQCEDLDESFVGRILSLGITASIAISVGSFIIVVVCSVSIVCCCCRYWKKRDQDPGGAGGGGGGVLGGSGSGGGGVGGVAGGGPGSCTTTTTATHVTINNGGPPPIVPNGYPHTQYSQQGYFPMHPGNTGPQSVTYSPFTQPREAYSQGTGSMYSSHAPPSYHRSYTPTSSRSGRSLHSHSNDSTSKYNGDIIKGTIPVNL